MAVLQNSVTYQGIKCHGVKYRRTDGLHAEFGYVVMNVKDIGAFEVKVGRIPWRAKNGSEMPGQLDLARAQKLLGNQTVASQPAVQRPAKGLNLFGDLVLSRYRDGGLISQTTYSDVYVAPGGSEELTERMARIRAHDEGMVEVALTDIRQFYPDSGLLFQGINTHLRTGRFDGRTTKTPSTPWPIQDVFKLLFSQLPGSPLIDPRSDLFSMKDAPPPVDIFGEGEPVVYTIERLLDQYALSAGFLPNGSYLLKKKWSNKTPKGNVATDVGRNRPGQYQYYEKKTVSGNGQRPPLVCAKGKKRIKRITLAYVPVIQWTDGRWYLLFDIARIANGYSLQQLNFQVLNNEGKNFVDVLGAAPSGQIGEQWIQLLRKYAYKAYAPACFFRPVDQSDRQNAPTPIPTGTPLQTTAGAAASGGNQATFGTDFAKPGTTTNPSGPAFSFSDEDLEALPYLPAMECPWYDFELAQLYFGVDQIPISGNVRGDNGTVYLMPPIVVGSGIGERFFTDSSELQKYFDRRRDGLVKDIAYYRTAIEGARLRARAYAQQIAAAQKHMQEDRINKALPNAPLVGPWLVLNPYGSLSQLLQSHPSKIPGTLIKLDDDIRVAANELQVYVTDDQLFVNLLDQGYEALAEFRVAAGEVKKWEQTLQDLERALSKVDLEKAGYMQAFGQYKGMACKANLPARTLSGGYSFDRRTGIVVFAEPMCQAVSPLSMADESQIVASDGAVSVTFGHEFSNNSIEDWTCVYIQPEDQPDGSVKPVITGLSRPSQIKASLVRVPRMRLWCDHAGVPMNLSDVKYAAVSAAGAKVAFPRSTVGYEVIYSGFEQCVLDVGINSVMHSWDGDGAARTHVFQNHPAGIGPLGPADTPTVGIAETRAQIRTALEELNER